MVIVKFHALDGIAQGRQHGAELAREGVGRDIDHFHLIGVVKPTP